MRLDKQKQDVIHLFSVIMMFCLLTILSSSISFADSKAFENLGGTAIYGTDRVNIKVECYRDIDGDGKLDKIPDIVKIEAGSESSYIPFIKNLGDDCNLRIKIYAESGDQKINIQKYCKGFEENWVLNDGWFYYKKTFKAKERVKLCDSFMFPEEWKYKENNQLDITVEAEAVADEAISKEAASKGTIPKTGDTTSLLLFCIILTMVTIMMITIFAIRRYDVKSDKVNDRK